VRPLSEQRILVTGSTDGLGRQLAAALAQREASVLIHGRDQAKVEEAVSETGAQSGLVADLADLRQVRSLAGAAGELDPMLERGYEDYRAYAQSKLAQVLFTIELADRLGERAITVNALHPATLMDTKMARGTFGRARSSVEEGVQATLQLIEDPELDNVSGRFFDGLRESAAHQQAYDPEARRRLWELSERLTK
jgi:NAD(P)-dependent dehydrogenase (short-subunit alcohol dehydrogenase family)